MHSTFAELVGDVFTNLNQVIKEQKQEEKWKVERNDEKSIQFIFGNVQFNRTLMYDDQNNPRYPLDDWLELRRRQKQSPRVESKVAEAATNGEYREVEGPLKEWTAVDISPSTVGATVMRVGEAEADADEVR